MNKEFKDSFKGKNCVWVFDTDACISRLGTTRFSVSLDDREVKDSQHVVSVTVQDLLSVIELLDSVSIARDSVINGLGQSYNHLIQRGVEKFTMNIYKYFHTEKQQMMT